MDNQTLLAIAEKFGTPSYVFDADEFARRCSLTSEALGCRLCFCVKANPFLTACLPNSVTRLEVCSPGELEVCRRAGISPKSILFSGLNKTRQSINEALNFGVELFTAESPRQLELLNEAGLRLGRRLPSFLRLTAGDQFGMDEDELRSCVRREGELRGVTLSGLHYFSGTQKTKARSIEKELTYLTEFSDELYADYGFSVGELEYGAGFFADYFGDDSEMAELALLAAAAPAIKKAAKRFNLTVELGRFLAAPCGAYLTAVHEVKVNCGVRYVITDGGTHQLHYDGQVMGMRKPPVEVLLPGGEAVKTTLCGSLCSLGDRLAQDVYLPEILPGNILAFRRAGAYSVTEGTALFLCRELPRVVLTGRGEPELLRDFVLTHPLSTPKNTWEF